MPSSLLPAALGVFLLFAIANWRAAVILCVFLGLLIYFVGLQATLMAFVGYGVLILVMEAGTALLVGLFILVSTTILGLKSALLLILAFLTVTFLIITLQLSRGQSMQKGLEDARTILIAVISSGFSTFVSRIELVGTASSPNQLFKHVLSWYPGSAFTKQLRDDVINRGEELVSDGAIEIDKSPETLAKEARRAYNDAGRFLSDGEANLAIILAVASLLPFLPEALSPPPALTPPDWTGVGLSLSLLVAVGLRQAALDEVLYQDVNQNERLGRLAAKSSWNQVLSNGQRVIQALTMFRAVKSISPTAYNYYLDWVFEQTATENGADMMGLFSEKQKMRCFIKADRQDITPSEASKQIFDEDIFTGPNEEELDKDTPDESLKSVET